jgi:hypothetical protein
VEGFLIPKVIVVAMFEWYGYVFSKWDISVFIKHLRSKTYRPSSRKILAKKRGRDNIHLLTRFLGILTTHKFDMGNIVRNNTRKIPQP